MRVRVRVRLRGRVRVRVLALVTHTLCAQKRGGTERYRGNALVEIPARCGDKQGMESRRILAD